MSSGWSDAALYDHGTCLLVLYGEPSKGGEDGRTR